MSALIFKHDFSQKKVNGEQNICHFFLHHFCKSLIGFSGTKAIALNLASETKDHISTSIYSQNQHVRKNKSKQPIELKFKIDSFISSTLNIENLACINNDLEKQINRDSLLKKYIQPWYINNEAYAVALKYAGNILGSIILISGFKNAEELENMQLLINNICKSCFEINTQFKSNKTQQGELINNIILRLHETSLSLKNLQNNNDLILPFIDKNCGVIPEYFLSDELYLTSNKNNVLTIPARILEQLKSTSRSEETHIVEIDNGNNVQLTNKLSLISDNGISSIKIDRHLEEFATKKTKNEILFESVRNLKQTETIAKIGRWELNLQSSHLYWSDSLYEIWEVEKKQENLTYESFIRSIHPEDREMVNDAYTNSLITKRPYVIEHRLLMPDGRIKWVKESCYTEYINETTPLKSIGVAQDISEIKNATLTIEKERDFQKLLSEISIKLLKISASQIDKLIYESIEKYSLFTGIDHCMFHVVNKNNQQIRTELYWHEHSQVFRLSKINFDYSPNSFISQQLEFRNHIIIDSINSIPVKYAREKREWKKLNTLSMLICSMEIDEEHFGRIYFIKKSNNPFDDEDIVKNKIFNNIIATAYTRYILETNYISSKLKAEKANNAKSEFVATISHELRTPINTVLGFSELLKQTKISNKQSDFLQGILSGGKNLMSLINDLLDISKIDTGHFKLEPLKCDVNLLLAEIGRHFIPTAQKKQISFIILTNEHLPRYIIIDEIRIKQVLFNLIDNAIKFTGSGSVTLELNFIPNTNNDAIGKLTASIRDTGIGIPKKQQKSIFHPFKQVQGQNNRIYGGTGLGLSIAKNIIELMNGTISVESNVKAGSCFTINIPNIEAVVSQTKKKKKLDTTEEVDFFGQIILFVEDIPDNQKILYGLLKTYNLKIVFANSGEQALKLIETFIPDLILMDIMMPVLDGYETAKRIRSKIADNSYPLIAFSASNPDPRESRKSLFNEYILKPVEGAKLVTILKKYLNHKILYRNKHLPNKTNNTNSKRILFVENDEMNRKFITQFLKKTDHKVTSVSSLTSAVRKLNAEKYDLIISDYALDKSNSNSICSNNFFKSASIPLIIISGYSKQEIKKKCPELLLAGYLRKPINLTKLLELINYNHPTEFNDQNANTLNSEYDYSPAIEASDNSNEKFLKWTKNLLSYISTLDSILNGSYKRKDTGTINELIHNILNYANFFGIDNLRDPLQKFQMEYGNLNTPEANNLKKEILEELKSITLFYNNLLLSKGII